MGGNKKRHEYDRAARLELLVSGIDEIPHGIRTGRLKGIQAGSRLYCIAVLRSRTPFAQFPAAIKVKLKSKFNQARKMESNLMDWGEKRGRLYHENVKWYQHVFRINTMAVPGTGAFELGTNMFRTDFPVQLDLPTSLCESMELDFPYNGFKVLYTIRVKVHFEGYPMWFKSKLEDIEIIAKAPEPHELRKSVSEIGKEKRNFAMPLTGKVKVKAFSDAFVYSYSDLVTVVARIDNNSGRRIKSGELSLVEEVEFPIIHDAGGQTVQRYKKRSVSSIKLRELAIDDKTSVDRTFAIELPEVMKPRTTKLTGKCRSAGQDRSLLVKFSHYVYLRFDTPGSDLVVRIPVVIVPLPNQGFFSPPTFPYQKPNPRNSGLPNQPAFVVVIRAAHNLPKMDPFFGKADPFVTILVNGKHYRCTRYIDNTSNPFWDETFRIVMTPEEYSTQPRLEVSVYDYDAHTANDLIGNVAGGIYPKREKKG